MSSFGKNKRLIASGALMTGASIGVFSNCAGVFIAPVCEEMGFSRGGFSLISTISLLLSMAMLPLFGRWLKNADIKRVVLVCAVACSAVPLGYSVCGRLWQFYLLAALNGLFVNGITMLTVNVMIDRCAEDGQAFAIGASFAGAGIASAVMLPLLQGVITAWGWRSAYRLESAAGISLLLLSALLVSGKGARNGDKAADEQGADCASAVATASFWLLAAGLFLANFVYLALYSHMTPYLIGVGFTAGQAALAASAAALVTVAAKPLYGALLGRFGVKTGAAVLGAILLLASAVALTAARYHAAALIYPLFAACCTCANSIPAGVFSAELFGRRDYSAITSRLMLAATAGAAAGAPAAGFVFDLSGGYNIMWCICAASGVWAGALLYLSVVFRRGKNSYL